jgi:hypothetical protein
LHEQKKKGALILMARIVAVVVTDSSKAAGGGAPILIAKDTDEQKSMAFLLEKILDAMAHDLKNGTMILVDRSGGAENS